jgi:hypothetical protein
MIEGELSTPRDIQAGVPQVTVLAPTLYNLYINDPPQTSGVYLALFANDTCTYTTDRKEGNVFTPMQAWCEHWNIKINEDNIQAIYFSHRRRQVEAYLTLKGGQVPFVNNVKYLCVIFDKMTSRNDSGQRPLLLLKSERISEP